MTPRFDALPEPSQAGAPPAPLAARLPPISDPGPYRIGIGDIVRVVRPGMVRAENDPVGSQSRGDPVQTYAVQDDGAIAIHDLGRITVAGLTLQEAEARLFQQMAERLVEPTFSLEVAEFKAARVSLGGAVANAAVLPITLTPLHLDEALARAGGIATADLTNTSIRMYRDGGLYQIPMQDYLSRPELQKLLLQDGDSIFVDTRFPLEKAQAFFEEQIAVAQLRQQARQQALAELNAEIDRRQATLTERRSGFQDLIALDAVPRDYIYLTGEVTNAGRQAMPFGRQMTLADGLYANGGFSAETGNPSQIYVLRDAGAGDVTAWQLDGRNVANLTLATRFNLYPNDIIFVAEQPVTRWNRVVQQLVPSLITSGAGIAVAN
ncbi:polysaccharide biosynthesis/export family protein [Yoonia sp. BS5-3]|uniref:Polysaccharide biosynthesis/export family protein n=1 Tax=Yoonia phaeophyticola TaxID=3137369 RepID=A0ABZ2V4V6_9RHOB